jgi:Arc/MetJ family transcription regulator
MKTMVDIDDEALAAAARVLGTVTKKDTVNAALRLAGARELRIAALLADPRNIGVGPHIADPQIMAGARR